MRTGMDTRSSGDSSSTATQHLQKDPANQIHPSQQAQAASSSQAGDNGSDTRPPNLPAIPVFPGSTEVDWMNSQLGLLSRGHFRMLDDIIAPVGRQLTPVSVIIFLCFVNYIPNYTSFTVHNYIPNYTSFYKFSIIHPLFCNYLIYT